MARPTTPELELLGRNLLIGLGRIGRRAAASAVRSVARDGQRVAKDIEGRFDRAVNRLDELADDTDTQPQDTRAPRK